jgi:hypothetical protein
VFKSVDILLLLDEEMAWNLISSSSGESGNANEGFLTTIFYLMLMHNDSVKGEHK